MAKMTITEKGAATLRTMMLRSMVLPPEFQSKTITYSLTSFNSFETKLGGSGQYIYHYWHIESRARQDRARQDRARQDRARHSHSDGAISARAETAQKVRGRILASSD